MSATEFGPVGSGLQILDLDECWSLLSNRKVGRVAWCDPRGPQVIPVNYTVVDQDIYVRTRPDSAVTRLLYENSVAFQVDDVDEFLESGWSVLVVGTATFLRDRNEIPAGPGERPEPWADGPREMYIRIHPKTVTGRRVVS